MPTPLDTDLTCHPNNEAFVIQTTSAADNLVTRVGFEFYSILLGASSVTHHSDNTHTFLDKHVSRPSTVVKKFCVEVSGSVMNAQLVRPILKPKRNATKDHSHLLKN